MFRSLACVALVLGLCTGCAGSDGHPPAIGDAPQGGTGAGGGVSPSKGGTTGGPQTVDKGLLDGGFINIPKVADINYDQTREVLLVSTTAGELATVDLTTGKVSTEKVSDGPLMGLDLSPSGRLLAIAENSVDADRTKFWVHLLDLEESSLREVYFPLRTSVHEGSHSVAFATDDVLFVTESFTAGGFTDFLQVDLIDDSFSTPLSIRDDSMLARSFDNSTVALARQKDGLGPVTVIDTSTLELSEQAAHAALHDLALNTDGSLIALPVSGKVQLLARQGSGDYAELEPTLTLAGRSALAAVFSPVADSIFVTWAPTDTDPAFVDRYSLDTLESEGLVDPDIALAETRQGGFWPTRMKLTPDGALLFVTAEKGVFVYALDP